MKTNPRFLVELSHVSGAVRVFHSLLQSKDDRLLFVRGELNVLYEQLCDYLGSLEEDKGEFEGIDTEIALMVSEALNDAIHYLRDNTLDIQLALRKLESIDSYIYDFIYSQV